MAGDDLKVAVYLNTKNSGEFRISEKIRLSKQSYLSRLAEAVSRIQSTVNDTLTKQIQEEKLTDDCEAAEEDDDESEDCDQPLKKKKKQS